MDQIRANTPAPMKANLMTEQLSVQMSWGNGGCTRVGSPGDQQSRELGPWAARRSRAMMRANAWGHDELSQSKYLEFLFNWRGSNRPQIDSIAFPRIPAIRTTTVVSVQLFTNDLGACEGGVVWMLRTSIDRSSPDDWLKPGIYIEKAWPRTVGPRTWLATRMGHASDWSEAREPKHWVTRTTLSWFTGAVTCQGLVYTANKNESTVRINTV